MTDIQAAVYLCGDDMTTTRQPCPEGGADHTPSPDGYNNWHDWASKMSAQGAVQRKCPTCGLYGLWSTPRKPVSR